MPRRMRTSLLVWFLVVSVLPVVPVMVFAGLVAARHLDRLQLDLHAALPERAGAAAAQVAHRLDLARVALSVLARSDAARRGDLDALQQHAQRVADDLADDAFISLIGPDGAPMFETQAGPGLARAAALLRQDSATLAAARPSQAPGGLLPTQVTESAPPPLVAPAPEAASEATPGQRPPVLPRLLVASLPLSLAEVPRHELRMVMSDAVFTRALQQQAWPEGWLAAVLDPRMIIAGRSREAERFVGQPATASLREALAAGRGGVLRTFTKEGLPAYTAVAPVGDSGWHVAVGASEDLLSREYRRTLVVLAVGAVTSLLLAGFASLLVSRWVRRWVRELVEATRQAPDDDPDTLADAEIAELAPVSEALREAHERERVHKGELNQARHDPLTGLATRAWLLKRARAEAEGRQRQGDDAERCAALFIDLDGFKQVNDRFGHQRGDQVLAEVGARILDAVRGHDLAGRWGGDEFVVCLSAPGNLVTAVARAVAERIISRVAGLGDGIACSIGVAVDVAGQQEVNGLIRLADEAMLAAKRAGKNQVVLSMH